MAPPSPQEIERKKQVSETLTNFRDALKRITNTAMNVQKGDQDFTILQQFFKPKSPSSHSENNYEDDEYGDASPSRSPFKVDKEADNNNDTFITGTGMGQEEEVKSPKAEDGALVLVKEGKDDLDVPEDEDNEGQVVDQMAVSGSRKV